MPPPAVDPLALSLSLPLRGGANLELRAFSYDVTMS